MNCLAKSGPLDHLITLECCRNMSAVAVAVVREDGHLLDCNAGFRRLLQARGNPESGKVAPFFFRPGFATLAATLAAGDAPVYEGVLIVGDNQVSCYSLLGKVYRSGANLIVVAEFDVAEMEQLNAQVLQFNEQLIDMQRELARKERRLRDSEAKLHMLSLTDPLTGLANRRQLEYFMHAAFQRVERHGETFSVIMLDIDHFKRINDTYGHDEGDIVLCHTAQVLRDAVREIDLAARIGGEEFVLVLSGADLPAALDCAERLRCEVVARRPAGLREDMSASFGVVQYHAGASPADMLKRADEAMYHAKRGGRNRVEAWAAPAPLL